MRFQNYLTRIRESLQGNRTEGRAKKRRQPFRLSFCRPRLEHLEDRIVLDMGSNLGALASASGTVAGFASSLSSGPLKQSMPIIDSGGSAVTLGQILGVNSIFNPISTALNNLTPANIAKVEHANDPSAELADVLNNGGTNFTATVTDNQILVTYTQSINNSSTVSAAQNPTDFFGSNQQTRYFSKIASLSGTGSGNLSSQFSITFGADDTNGFFVAPGKLFSSGDFKASLNLSGKVNVGQLAFDVALNGTGDIDLHDINLALTQQVSGSAVQNIGQDASLSVGSGSNASVTAEFTASVLNTPLVHWGATGPNATPIISWSFDPSNGALQQANVSIPKSGIEAASILGQDAESAVETAMLKSLSDSLGLSRFITRLNPLAQVPADLQSIITFVTSMTEGDINGDINNPKSPHLDPESSMDQLDSQAEQNSSWFTVDTDPMDLWNFANGQAGANLITFATPKPIPLPSIPNIDVNTPPPPYPLFSFAGLINGTLTGGIKLDFNNSASLSAGIDSNGLYIDTNPSPTITDPTSTNITFDATADVFASVKVDVAGIGVCSLKAGPQGDIKAILELQGPPSKLYLSSISNIDLKNNLQLEVDLSGNIVVDLRMNTPVDGLAKAVPGPVGDLLQKYAGDVQSVTDYLANRGATAANSVTSFLGFGNVVDSSTAQAVASLPFGDYLNTLEPFFTQPSVGATWVWSDNNQAADAIWTWKITNSQQIFQGSQITSGQGNSTSDSSTQSGQGDFIRYQVNGSTLTITGAPGTDNISVKDLGDGQIELSRTGIDSQGQPQTDPTHIFSGINQIVVTMNDSSGTMDSFVMDSTLAINTTVNGGAGNETIITGTGNDTINGGNGNDYLDAGDGTNYINAGSGQDTLVGGSGTDYMKGGSGGDYFQAGNGTEYMYGGSGADTFVAGSGSDVVYGGGGNDTFKGGGGSNTFYGQGGPNDTDAFFGGSGSVAAYGGQGANNYTAGSGTMDVHGGPGQDTVYWQVGDGNVKFDGGGTNSPTAPDTLQLTGSPGPNAFSATANGTGVSIAAPSATVSATNIQVLLIDGGSGADSVTVNNLAGTTIQAVGINFSEIGNPDGFLDTTTLIGPSQNTVDINETTGTGQVFQPPQPGQVIQVANVSGTVMSITGLGPIMFVPDDEDLVNVDPGGNNIVNVDTPLVKGTLTVNGGTGVNRFNAQKVGGVTTINTQGGKNTINVGSNAPAINGILTGIQGALTINGSNGSDTANVDDTGATANRSGTLTPKMLTGLGMGPSGITFSGLNKLNLNVGQGASATDTFNITEINTPSLVTGPTYAFATQIPTGRLLVSGNIGSVHVDTGTPGSFAGPVATATLYEGYSPWTLQEFYTPPANFSPPTGGTLSSNNPTPPGSSNSVAGQPVDTVPDPGNAPSAPAAGVSSASGGGAVPTALVASAGGSSPAAPPSQPSIFTLLFDLYEMELNLFEMELSWLESLVNLKGLPLP